MTRVFLLSVALCLASASSMVGQAIEGRVLGAFNRDALVGASVMLNDSISIAVADANGNFRLENVPQGVNTLRVSYLGYQTYIDTEVWVKSGKVTYLEIAMTPGDQELNELVISGSAALRNVSSIQITEEKINRIAASYNDPARLIVASSDAMVTNDQNNQISVRGLSPDLNIWRLEGVEIVNPNHLSNAGTFNDQPAATGGGVNILSAQMLDRSQFHIGHMDNSIINGTAGVFDMNLRNGYAGDHQFTAQASFIGFDFSAEGPLSQNKKASYLANYRYSFTGLLGLMGVDFGGETIGFQDLSVNVHMPFDNGSSLKVFALGGLSTNDFVHRPYEESEIEKDRSDINYKGEMGAFGLNFTRPVNDHVKIRAISTFSALDNHRMQRVYDDTNSIDFTQSNTIGSSILANRIDVEIFKTWSVVNLGSHINLYNAESRSEWYTAKDNSKLLLAPYVNFELNPSPRHEIFLGGTYYRLENNTSLLNDYDYRLSYKYNHNKLFFGFAAGKYSQTRHMNMSFVPFEYRGPFDVQPGQHLTTYMDLVMISSYRLTAQLGYRTTWGTFSAEAFQYTFPEVFESLWSPVTGDNPDGNVQINKPSTTGTHLSWQNDLKNIYYRVDATLFNATNADGSDLPHNIKRSFGALFGKKWNLDKGQVSRDLHLDLKGIYQGGIYQAYSNYHLDDYARIDLRVQWIKYLEKSTRSWSLDIQNLTNRQNEAAIYMDGFTDQYETTYQLGLIPILTYRIEF